MSTVGCVPIEVEISTDHEVWRSNLADQVLRKGDAPIWAMKRWYAKLSTEVTLVSLSRDPIKISEIVVNNGNPGCQVNGDQSFLPGLGAEMVFYVLVCDVLEISIETDHGSRTVKFN